MIDSLNDHLRGDASPPHIHSAFRFPARLHHRVSSYIISEFTKPGDFVLDPFVGCGTNQIEAGILGRNSVGIDIDPLSVFVTKAKTSLRKRHLPQLLEFSGQINAILAGKQSERDYERLMHRDIRSVQVNPNAIGISDEVFALLTPWFRKYAVEDLHFILKTIRKISKSRACSNIALLAFASAIRSCSNADPVPVSGLEYTRRMRERDEEGRVVDPFQQFLRRFNSIVEGAGKFAVLMTDEYSHTTRQGDCTRAAYGDQKFKLIFFSPPYLNAVEYSRRHKLEMGWLGLIKSHDEFVKLAGRYVGHRACGKIPLEHQSLFGPETDSIRIELLKRDYRRARSFAKYCRQMNAVFTQMKIALSRGGRCAVVVGNNTVAGLEIPADKIFEEVARPLKLVEATSYSLRNRYMSYKRHNGADIGAEHVLVFGR